MWAFLPIGTTTTRPFRFHTPGTERNILPSPPPVITAVVTVTLISATTTSGHQRPGFVQQSRPGGCLYGYHCISSYLGSDCGIALLPAHHGAVPSGACGCPTQGSRANAGPSKATPYPFLEQRDGRPFRRMAERSVSRNVNSRAKSRGAASLRLRRLFFTILRRRVRF
jgi:hypothetical protein